MTKTLEQRFADKWTPEPMSGCWLWTGEYHRAGYGIIQTPRRVRAHRASYELHVGPIPGGLFVCHRCDQPWCVNPAHLFVGTHRDNMADMTKKGRHAGWPPNARCVGNRTPTPGERNSQAKLTAKDVMAIRARCAAGELQRVVAAAFHLTQGHVSALVRRARWGHL